MKIILGSQSKSRRQLLERLGYTFEVMPADLDEKSIRSDDYEALPLLLARAKADALLLHIDGDAILITSDQVVVWNGELREKPESREQAREFLESYAVSPAQTNTAVVAHNTRTGKRYEGVDIARVYYRPIPKEVIEQLLQEGSVLYVAGGFMVEHPLLVPYVERIEGTQDSIMGLPLDLTKDLIARVQG